MSTKTVGFLRPSTKARYGLRLVLALAQSQGKTLPLSKLSKYLGVSKKYLEKIARILKEQGIIEATRGINGGYRLIPKPSHINLLNLLSILESRSVLDQCFVQECPKIDRCRAGDFWRKLENDIARFLDKTTIADIIKEV
ncbi:hypothetical protein BXT86_00490 [candidate division WOR-3 bacterium 4484_100]|uniref:Rrf2 family transcriptional regulator n=1 Tax=candidate division WOR-3 bacterium 4484_100 TaxID=1936077 RepID=A0A1V4QHV5_UNCW3|nr:MAG: hypothetical protein BXT86_00490 [candidate division WOR-3 bacterium 4484_100]